MRSVPLFRSSQFRYVSALFEFFSVFCTCFSSALRVVPSTGFADSMSESDFRGCLIHNGNAVLALIWWQWRAKNPIMNLRLFKYKNFAICCFLMILVGGLIHTTTVLHPSFCRS
jgi:hypothetical protein